MFFFDTCNAVAAREERKPKYWRLGRRHLGLSLMLWRHNVKRDILNMTCDCWFPCSCVYWSLVRARKIIRESRVIDSSSITQSKALWIWRCDVTTSNSIKDDGALVVNILVFDLRVQLQHCTYQRKALLFALIKVITFICNLHYDKNSKFKNFRGTLASWGPGQLAYPPPPLGGPGSVYCQYA